MKQHIRFCRASDGVRMASATMGSGPPLVRVSNWLTHLSLDWKSPVWSHWFEERALVRRFGDRYREYRKRVPMLVPRLISERRLQELINEAASSNREAGKSLS